MHDPIDFTTHQRAISKHLGAGGITLRNGSAENLDFLGNGKAKAAWQQQWSRDEGVFVWDNVGRINLTAVGWDWLLIKSYRSERQFKDRKGLSFNPKSSGVNKLLSIGHDKISRSPIESWREYAPDYALRLSTIAFLRKNGVCCRLLFAFDCSDSMTRPRWQKFISESNDRLGINYKHPLSNRIFHYFYEGGYTVSR